MQLEPQFSMLETSLNESLLGLVFSGELRENLLLFFTILNFGFVLGELLLVFDFDLLRNFICIAWLVNL